MSGFETVACSLTVTTDAAVHHYCPLKHNCLKTYRGGLYENTMFKHNPHNRANYRIPWNYALHN